MHLLLLKVPRCPGLASTGQVRQIGELHQRLKDLEGQLLAKDKEITVSRTELSRKEGLLRVAAGAICAPTCYRQAKSNAAELHDQVC